MDDAQACFFTVSMACTICLKMHNCDTDTEHGAQEVQRQLKQVHLKLEDETATLIDSRREANALKALNLQLKVYGRSVANVPMSA